MTSPIRIAHGIMAALFALSVALQFNDPGPAPWIALYGACAAASGLAAAGRPPRRFALALLVICALWEIHYLTVGAWRTPVTSLADEWHMTNQNIVDGREFWALLLLGGWMAVVWRSKANPTPTPLRD
jgi:hypothetical protein